MVKNVLAQILTAGTWADTLVLNSPGIISLEDDVVLVPREKRTKTVVDNVDSSGQPQFSPIHLQFLGDESSGLQRTSQLVP